MRQAWQHKPGQLPEQQEPLPVPVLLVQATAGAFGAAVGSFASQGFNIAAGLQDKISWKNIAIGAITDGASEKIGAALRGVNVLSGKATFTQIQRALKFQLRVPRQAVQSLLNNAVGQVTNRVFGLQKGFN